MFKMLDLRRLTGSLCVPTSPLIAVRWRTLSTASTEKDNSLIVDKCTKVKPKNMYYFFRDMLKCVSQFVTSFNGSH